MILNKKFLDYSLDDSKNNEKKNETKSYIFLISNFDLVHFHNERKEQYTLNTLNTLQDAAFLCPNVSSSGLCTPMMLPYVASMQN